MNAPFKYDLFLTFAKADRAWVEGFLIPALGLPRECLLTPDNFQLGAPQVDEIERAIKSSHHTLLILSPAYLADEWSNLSEQLASYLTTTEAQTRLIPLLKAECEIPLHIEFRVRLDCTDQANWEREVARLRDLLNQPATQLERIECPYPGMIPFRVEDARWFYGRTKEIDELVRRVRVQNFLFVIGPSGSGKSSLVFAGLVAEINKRQPNKWLVRTMRPGSDPLAALNEVATGLQDHSVTRLLLIIDQFEELFTLADRSQQAAFIARLKTLRVENQCVIVATMRADFYPNLMNSDLWPLDPSERFEIAPLRGQALEEAIIKPAEQVGVYLEAGLVEQLVADAADEPGVLPLVQETMVLLWEKREWRLITRRAYQGLGQGSLSGLAVAVATRADAVFLQLTESQRIMARRIFLRLIQFGEGRLDTRRQQPVSALRASHDDAGEFDRTLKHLTDHRLLTSSGEEREGERKIDIAHEALITGWNRLRQWVNERREAEQTRRRLETKASEWERLGRGDAGLLDAIELREAEHWLASADAVDLGYSEALTRLVGVSRATLQQAEQEKEQTRQHELAQAKALADEQRQRAETERKSRVRQRYFTIGLAMFLVIAIVAAGFAFQQRGEAQSQTKLATSRELAASAISNLTTDPELAALLAIQANQVAHTYESEDALRQATRLMPLATLRGDTSNIMSVAWSPDSKQIVTTSYDGIARVWDAITGHELATLRGHTSNVSNAAWSPNGKQIVTVSDDTTARVWDATTGRELVNFSRHARGITTVAWNPDGNQIVTASTDGTTRIWDAATGQELVFLQGYRAAWSPDGKRIVTANGDTARIWDAARRRELAILPGHLDMVTDVAWSSDGKKIVTASMDDTARVWDTATYRDLTTLRGHTNDVWSAVWSPNGKQIVTVSDDTTARVWDATTGRELLTLRGYTNMVNSAAWSPDSKQIVSANGDVSTFIWDAETGSQLATLWGYGAAWSPDGKQIVTLIDDQTARVWNAAGGYELPTLREYSGSVLSPRESPDGKHIVIVGNDNTARVKDATTGRELLTLRGHTSRVNNAAWSPDGKQIVTASGDSAKNSDNTARIWDATTGRELATLRGHTGFVKSAGWSPDGKQIVITSYDGTSRIYLTHIEDLVALVKSRLSRELTCAEREKYLHEEHVCPTPIPTPALVPAPTRAPTPKP